MSGTILATEKYIDQYKSGSEGIIVNTASVAGLNPAPLIPAYSASKSAVIAFSTSYGSPGHYARYPVRILTICPGGTETNLFQSAVVGWYSDSKRDEARSWINQA